MDLSHHFFQAPIPTILKNLENLVYLNLSSNKPLGGIPTELGDLKNLAVLILSRDGLVGQIPVTFNKLTALRFLDVRDNNMIIKTLSTDLPAELYCRWMLNQVTIHY